MTVEDLERELRALPPDEAAALLRATLERDDLPAPQPREWRAAVEAVLRRHRSAWERLARR